jgi:hypothetical protein
MPRTVRCWRRSVGRRQPRVGVDVAGLGEADAIARVRGWFEITDRSWLLVFDNAESPDVVRQLLPATGAWSGVDHLTAS